MSSLVYAELDGNNICTGVNEYLQTLNNPPSNYQQIDSFDTSVIGKKWNGSSFEEV